MGSELRRSAIVAIVADLPAVPAAAGPVFLTESVGADIRRRLGDDLVVTTATVEGGVKVATGATVAGVAGRAATAEGGALSPLRARISCRSSVM